MTPPPVTTGKVLGLDVGRHIGYCLEFPEASGMPPLLGCAVVCPAKAPEPQLRDGATAWLDRFFAEDQQARALGPEDTVVIERQLRQNERCRRLEQHLVSYFYFRHPDPACRPKLVVQSAKLKGFCHGAPRNCKGPDLKRWAVETVEQILRARGLPGLPLPVGLDANSAPARKDKLEDAADAYLTVSAYKVTGGNRVLMPPTRKRQRRPRAKSVRKAPLKPKPKPKAASRVGMANKQNKVCGKAQGEAVASPLGPVNSDHSTT